MNFTIGFDVSTACSGYTVLDNKGKIAEIGYVELNRPPKNPPSFWERAKIMEDKVYELKEKYEISHVFIEEIIKSKGRNSNSNTILKLAQFNALVSYFCFTAFGFEPQHIPVRSARKRLNIPQRRGDTEIKEKVFMKLTEGCGFDVPVTLKRTGRKKDYVYDMSDSLLIAYVGFLGAISQMS